MPGVVHFKLENVLKGEKKIMNIKYLSVKFINTKYNTNKMPIDNNYKT